MSVYQQPNSEVLKMVRDVLVMAEHRNLEGKLKPMYNKLIIDVNEMIKVARKEEEDQS